MPKALKKNPRSLRLGAAEIEAAALLGKPVDHLVARETRPSAGKAIVTPTIDPDALRMLQESERHTARARRLFGHSDGATSESIAQLSGATHVGGGSQDVADAKPPASLALSHDELDTLQQVFYTDVLDFVDVSRAHRRAIRDFLAAAPPHATAEQLSTLVEALS